MKSVGIPSSKYQLCLEDDQKQWFLRLRIDNAIEEELPLTRVEEKNFRHNIVDILSTAQLKLNKLQIDLIYNELWKYIENKLNPKSPERNFGTIQDPRYDELVTKIDTLNEKLDALMDRLSAAEMKLT